MLPPLKRIDEMKVMNIVDFYKQAPRNATHVLKRNDVFEYANYNRGYYDSCDNCTRDEMLKNPMAGNKDWFFKIGKGDWSVHLEL